MKHIVVLFYHVGGYHAARLRATHEALLESGGRLTALQMQESTSDHPWGAVSVGFPLLTVPGDGAPLESLLDELQPDAVAIPGWGFSYSRTALKWCKRKHVCSVVMSESKEDDATRHPVLEWFKSKAIVQRFDAGLVGCEAHRDYLVKLGIPSKKIFFGYDAVDNEYFQKATEAARANPMAVRERHTTMSARPYFLTVTRFISRKNILPMLEAYRYYRHETGEDTSWDLVICGSGEGEKAIRRQIERLHLERCVHLPGFQSYQSIPDWYALASALIHPALIEQWGLVINEACASGLPILCSRTIGARDLVKEGQNGFQFDPRQPVSMAMAMARVHHLRPEERRAMRDAGRRIVSEYGPEKFAEGLLNAVRVGGAQ